MLSSMIAALLEIRIKNINLCVINYSQTQTRQSPQLLHVDALRQYRFRRQAGSLPSYYFGYYALFAFGQAQMSAAAALALVLMAKTTSSHRKEPLRIALDGRQERKSDLDQERILRVMLDLAPPWNPTRIRLKTDCWTYPVYLMMVR